VARSEADITAGNYAHQRASRSAAETIRTISAAGLVLHEKHQGQ
jgi:hypothetical protein